jgi:glycosyltransferase involved in cell wall biosynthesis
LAARNEIHAVSLAEQERDSDGIREMSRIFASYTPVYWKEHLKYSPRFYLELAGGQLNPLPYFIAKCRTPEFTRALAKLADGNKFDLLFCDFLQSAAAGLELAIRPRVVFEHNVEYLLRKRQWQAEEMPLKKIIFAREWKKTQKIEERICNSFDRVIAVSDDDRQEFEKSFGVHNVSIIPTGVDCDYFKPLAMSPQPGRLVFVGSMDWYPNEDGMKWFLKEVYPRIRRAVPTSSLTIVGRNPSPALSAIAGAETRVALTGRVEDVRPYISEAEVVVVPLRVGGGTRIKIPEAMAMAKPLVSTTIGAEGLVLNSGRDILLADNPDTFAAAVVTLLNDAAKREAVGREARDRSVRDYGWDGVVSRVEEILTEVVRGRGNPKPSISETALQQSDSEHKFKQAYQR